MRTFFVASGLADLAVFEWPGAGTPILALHPNIADSRIWQSCAPVWAQAGHRVVAYDRRGFGQTRYAEQPHDSIDDLRAVSEASSCRPAVVVGNSRGGSIALDLALAYPAEVSAVVLIGSGPSGYPDGSWQTSAAEDEQDGLRDAAELSGDIDLYNRLEMRYWLDGTEQPEGRVGGAARELLLEMNDRALRADPIGNLAERPLAWPRLADVSVPVLVVVGEYDLPGFGSLSQQLADALPHGRLATMAGTAHCPSLDRPDELNRLILDFVESLPGGDRRTMA